MHCPRCGEIVLIAGDYDPDAIIYCQNHDCYWLDRIYLTKLEDDINRMIASAPQDRYLDGEKLIKS